MERIIRLEGRNITFDAADRLFANIHVKSDKSVIADKSGKIKTDYIHVDNGYIDYNVSNCNPDIVVKAYVEDADPPSVTLPVQTENHSDVAPLAERIILSKVKKLTVRRKKSGKVVLKWKKVRGAEKYEVIYSAGKEKEKIILI